ncbi:hypothetical protein SAMN03159424_04069, partial [Pseudomonas sp. NFACC05-1]
MEASVLGLLRSPAGASSLATGFGVASADSPTCYQVFQPSKFPPQALVYQNSLPSLPSLGRARYHRLELIRSVDEVSAP